MLSKEELEQQLLIAAVRNGNYVGYASSVAIRAITDLSEELHRFQRERRNNEYAKINAG